MREKALSKYHSKVGTILKCPHCEQLWLPSHFSWVAVVCQGCKKKVDKTEWLIEGSEEKEVKKSTC